MSQTVLILVVLLTGVRDASDSQVAANALRYAERKAAAVTRCHAIDPAESQTGLIFNPAGYRSFFIQSECFQQTAVLFRDEALCSLVKERQSLLFSSWAISPAQCRRLVAEGAQTDEGDLAEVKRRYLQEPVRLRDVRLQRNGNGRDFDVIPVFSGGFAHRYTLEIELVGESGRVLVDRTSYHLDGSNNIRVFVRYDDLLKRYPQLTEDRPHVMRAVLVLEVGEGSPSGQWSDAFVERVFPLRDRRQSIDLEVRFR
jgi:hypothetical protein